MSETATGGGSQASESSPSDSSPDQSTEESASGVSVADISATLSRERPDVQEHAIAESQAQTAAEVKLDKQGTAFDPARHTGSLLKDGSWRMRTGAKAAPGERPPRPSGARKATVSTLGAATTGPAATPNAPQLSKEQQARASGQAAANLLMVVGIGLGGEEWQPRRDDKIGLDEKVMLETAFGDYFVATGKTDLPPGWALVACIGMYAAPRFTMPKTRSRVERVKLWFISKVAARRAKKAGLRTQEPQARGMPETAAPYRPGETPQ